jgi:hypothetical protein
MTPMDVWQSRFEAVDRAIHRSKSAWAIDYWTTVRMQLLRKMRQEVNKRYL